MSINRPNHPIEIPIEFAETIVALFGEKGQVWLEQLPSLLETCAERWSLTLFPPFSLSYNYVAPAQRADGTDVVLKVGVPISELRTELEALRIYDGRGIVHLLDADWSLGALLLERLNPGTMLVEVDDDEATVVAAEVMQQLWQPVPAQHNFPTVAHWAKGLQRLRHTFDGGTGPFPRTLVEAAEAHFADLIASSAEPVLLHGDLHHFNILAAERQLWLALDPKGVVGEPAYEVGALLRNPMPQIAEVPHLHRVLAHRIDILADILGFDTKRLAAWGLAQAVLSAWWSYEDNLPYWETALRIAWAFNELTR